MTQTLYGLADGTYRVIGGEFVRDDKITGYYVATTNLYTGGFAKASLTRIAGLPLAGLIGVWTDAETGLVYVDRVVWFSRLSGAIAEGAYWSQLAIWDIVHGKEIRL